MSATIRTNYIAPGVQDPAPWQQALALPKSPWQQALATTKQDTGAGVATTQPRGMSVDYTAEALPSGAGNPFGYDYAGAAPPGYNAWALYNGGTQDGGWYNAGADTQRWDAGRGDGTQENSRDRVWRWTIDTLRAQGYDPGAAPVEVVNRLFLDNVARLHRDFDANNYNWQQSGFANFDRAQPGGGGTPGGGTPGTPGTQGGTTVDPSAGRNSVPPQNSGGQNVAGGTTSPNGGTSTTFPNFGQLGNVDPILALQGMQQDPAVAAHYLRLAAGQSGPVTGRLGQFKDNLYGRALQTFLALQGVGGNGTGFGGAQDFLSAMNSGNLQGLLNTSAGNAAGADFSGQDDATTEKILRAAIALRSLDMGSLGSSLMSGNLDNLLYAQEGAGIEDNGGASQVGGGLGRLLNGGSPYGAALQHYLSLR